MGKKKGQRPRKQSTPKAIESYRHSAPTNVQVAYATPPDPDDDPERWRERPCFYVSIRDRTCNDGSRDRYMIALGPFRTHQEAVMKTVDVMTKVEEIDVRAMFWGYGTCKMSTGKRDGHLNGIMGFSP